MFSTKRIALQEKHHDDYFSHSWLSTYWAKRELKFACKSYWKGESTQVEFLTKSQTVTVEANNWQAQIKDSLFLEVIFI